ncbi:hypothetical protein [Candidatus Aalborgicola defluviihabitans]|uniref:hypothetical protein n=1 Tax=Candidatus Aalborgicola defluviihabitans TaxID=3386187 RepID=UPI001EC59673|nr:hypothetical protein [Burkholderiales bacterium]
MSDLVETRHYDEASDSLVVKTSYDSRAVLADNILTKNLQPETGRYKGNLVKVATIHLGDVVRLKNLGYNILSPDPDEVKRALLYIQSEEKAHMVMPGTPIGKKRQSWS